MVTKPNALSFCRSYLRRSPKATYAQVKKAADTKKIALWPISYGRAKALEGLLPKKKKAKKKVAKKRGRPKGSKNKPKAKLGRGRPKGSKNRKKGGVNLSSLEGLLSTLKTLQRERHDALRTLAKIRDLVG